ncbi:MAG: radical SAM protein [Candidatus Omnitrophica bacterium]|nr:radical SAM protein [Candidatus Omnitrophota bacterium]
MKGGNFFRLRSRELIKLPYGSEIFMLPGRAPVGYSAGSGKFVTPSDNYAVAAFVPPGRTITYNSAYREAGSPKTLPLFAYGAVAFYKGDFYAAAVQVDRELRQDLRLMDAALVSKNVKRYRKLYPSNRLIRHLEGCALKYGCPAAKNFFLERYEGPLPTSPHCNAYCIGCISHQPAGGCSITQPRIKFVPSAEEIAETALHHIGKVKDPVVSFGQGCEGEPLLVGKIIEKAVTLIRKSTGKGIININTNASRPDTIKRLFKAGMDSMRVSLNSAQEPHYIRYYKPRGYRYKDVIRSIREAKKARGFVSINYLTMPGFTDTKEEFDSLRKLIRNCKIDMIQWRNLNFDPARYFKELRIPFSDSKFLGMRRVISAIKKEFPHVLTGYFNPSRQRIRRKRGQTLFEAL